MKIKNEPLWPVLNLGECARLCIVCVNPKAMQTVLFSLRDVLKNSSWAWACSWRDFPADCSLQHHQTPALTYTPTLRDSCGDFFPALPDKVGDLFLKSPEANNHYNAPALESLRVSVCLLARLEINTSVSEMKSKIVMRMAELHTRHFLYHKNVKMKMLTAASIDNPTFKLHLLTNMSCKITDV